MRSDLDGALTGLIDEFGIFERRDDTDRLITRLR